MLFRSAPKGAISNQADPARSDNLPVLTGLRFVAAFSVMLAHGFSTLFNFRGFDTDPYQPVYWLLQTSGFGMTLFFVLSGFVIHYNYRGVVANGGWHGLGWFMWARFARLYPLFILLLAVNILLSRRMLNLLAGEPDGFRSLLEALPYFFVFAQSWFYGPIDQVPVYGAIGGGSPITWSISTEWFFYLRARQTIAESGWLDPLGRGIPCRRGAA